MKQKTIIVDGTEWTLTALNERGEFLLDLWTEHEGEPKDYGDHWSAEKLLCKPNEEREALAVEMGRIVNEKAAMMRWFKPYGAGVCPFPKPKTKADVLRYMARKGQYGHSRAPHNYYLSQYGGGPEGWHFRDLEPAFSWADLEAFSLRYRRFHRHMTEVAPQWEWRETIHWADNSVEEVQVSRKTGQSRRVMTTAPHGDLCF